jgi:hypothetical protein
MSPKGRDRDPGGDFDWDKVPSIKDRPLTVNIVTRVRNELLRLIKPEKIGDRTFHALKPRIEELHDLELNSYQIAAVLAYEYRLHSRLSKDVAAAKAELARSRDKALGQQNPPGFTVKKALPSPNEDDRPVDIDREDDLFSK